MLYILQKAVYPFCVCKYATHFIQRGVMYAQFHILELTVIFL